MSYFRIIPRLDIKGENVVKGINLEGLRVVGQPGVLAHQYYQAGADEIIFMDIVASLYNRNNLSEIIASAAKHIFIPITVGGGIKTIDDAAHLFRMGADKVAINTAATKNPTLLSDLSDRFGAQSVVLSVEAKKNDLGWEVYTDNGREKTGLDVLQWIKTAQDYGIGEILLTSIDQEGTKKGADLSLLSAVSNCVKVPLIMCGGIGTLSDIAAVRAYSAVDGIAASSVFHYQLLSIQSCQTPLTMLDY